MQAASAGEYRVRLWVPGDWNAFFGFFTNVALNVIVLTGLSLGVVTLPNDIVFGRILPALGMGGHGPDAGDGAQALNTHIVSALRCRMTASSGAMGETRRPGKIMACTRCKKPSALPEGTR